MRATLAGAPAITRREIEAQAVRLESDARSLLTDTTYSGESGQSFIGAGSNLLFRFPQSSATLGASTNENGGYVHRMFRHITVLQGASRPQYCLIEEERVMDPHGRLARVYEPVVIFSSERAVDTLTAGFMRIDEDRLLSSVEPITNQIMASGFTLDEWHHALMSIQELTTHLDLSPAARLRMKADAVDLVEGRLELGDFVARTIARQDRFSRFQCIAESNQISASTEV